MVHQSGATGPKTDLRTSFSLDNLLLKCPDANCPGLLRAGPSGEKRCTQHHMVPISLEISLLTLPVRRGLPGRSGLQRALLSVSSTRKCSGAERLAAPLRGSRAARAGVPCRSSASGHRAISSKYTRGQS